jgi:monoamine oxidase
MTSRINDKTKNTSKSRTSLSVDMAGIISTRIQADESLSTNKKETEASIDERLSNQSRTHGHFQREEAMASMRSSSQRPNSTRSIRKKDGERSGRRRPSSRRASSETSRHFQRNQEETENEKTPTDLMTLNTVNSSEERRDIRSEDRVGRSYRRSSRELGEDVEWQNRPKEGPRVVVVEAPRVDDEDEAPREWYRRYARLLLFLTLLVTGAVIAAVLVTGKDSEEIKTVPSDLPLPTDPPTVNTTDKDTSIPERSTNVPSSVPSVFQAFDPPNLEDCQSISEGKLTMDQEQEVFSRSFRVDLDVTLAMDTQTTSWLAQLQSVLQKVLMPELAGCEFDGNRRLGDDDYPSFPSVRRLTMQKFAISNGVVVDTKLPSNSTCLEETPMCYRVTVTVDIWLKTEVRLFLLISRLVNLFTDHMESVTVLEPQIDNIQAIGVSQISATESPSSRPTASPSMLSAAPSATPSRWPSASPSSSWSQPTDSPSATPSMSAVDAIIVGAGAAGLTAAYTLERQGLSVLVLEASDHIGGRVKKDSTWDVDLDLGAEWIHVYAGGYGNPNALLSDIVDRNINVPTFQEPSTNHFWDGTNLSIEPDSTISDYRWVDSTWWDFFNEEVASNLRPSTISLNSVVRTIDYNSQEPRVFCEDGSIYQASFVIVTASMQMLQDGAISFIPSLPASYQNALNRYDMGTSMKVFLQFQEEFYPHSFFIESDFNNYDYDDCGSSSFGQRYFYDPTVGQTSALNILGMWSYGGLADIYAGKSGDDVIESMLSLLDDIFDGKASATFIKGVVADWSTEPYIRTAYTQYVPPNAILAFLDPIDRRIFFAGEAVPADADSWGYAHGAALSGKRAATQIIDIIQ